jgi:hypothetical protein
MAGDGKRLLSRKDSPTALSGEIWPLLGNAMVAHKD